MDEPAARGWPEPLAGSIARGGLEAEEGPSFREGMSHTIRSTACRRSKGEFWWCQSEGRASLELTAFVRDPSQGNAS